MVIFHSYVKLPEGNPSFNVMGIPPVGPVPVLAVVLSGFLRLEEPIAERPAVEMVMGVYPYILPSGYFT